jgi:hypothetical protein
MISALALWVVFVFTGGMTDEIVKTHMAQSVGRIQSERHIHPTKPQPGEKP